MTTLLCLDTETSGTDVYNDHIVTAFLGLMDETGNWTRKLEWLIDFGGEIPEGAAAVHGISTQQMRAKGRRDVQTALLEIRSIIEYETGRGTPLVIYNASFDLTLLNSELRRHDRAELDVTHISVIDPFVIDKEMNKYRKGKRTLTTIAPYYNVPVETNAHDAGADCLMTGRIALHQLRSLGETFESLTKKQKVWKAEQASSLQHYFRTKASPLQPDAVVDPGWPVQAGRAAA